ncbi:hypothetical protein [Paenibacillus sp. FSL H3-0333]|uniref:hypothetical protein n=1 Tax=Paenibacillus sp. FSL H3-0333 TaxID=2921373 RepID=UPI0030F64F18
MNIISGDKARKLFKAGEERFEYLDYQNDWRIFDHKFDRISKFDFYDKWRTY